MYSFELKSAFVCFRSALSPFVADPITKVYEEVNGKIPSYDGATFNRCTDPERRNTQSSQTDGRTDRQTTVGLSCQ